MRLWFYVIKYSATTLRCQQKYKLFIFLAIPVNRCYIYYYDESRSRRFRVNERNIMDAPKINPVTQCGCQMCLASMNIVELLNKIQVEHRDMTPEEHSEMLRNTEVLSERGLFPEDIVAKAQKNNIAHQQVLAEGIDNLRRNEE